VSRIAEGGGRGTDGEGESAKSVGFEERGSVSFELGESGGKSSGERTEY